MMVCASTTSQRTTTTFKADRSTVCVFFFSSLFFFFFAMKIKVSAVLRKKKALYNATGVLRKRKKKARLALFSPPC